MSSDESIGDILHRRLRSRGLDRAALAAYICATADRLGEGRFSATRFRDGQLTICVPSAVAAHELSFELETLATKIRAALSWPTTTPLVIRIKIRE